MAGNGLREEMGFENREMHGLQENRNFFAK